VGEREDAWEVLNGAISEKLKFSFNSQSFTCRLGLKPAAGEYQKHNLAVQTNGTGVVDDPSVTKLIFRNNAPEKWVMRREARILGYDSVW